MRYILEAIKIDKSKEEVEISKEDYNSNSFGQLYTRNGFRSDEIEKIILWREYDSIEEAASDNDKCIYYFGEYNGNRTLRSCSASQSRRLWG